MCPVLGGQDFLALDAGVPPELISFYGLAQFPLVGQALVMAYNISTLGPNDPALVRWPCQALPFL